MRACVIVVALALLVPQLATAADFDRPYAKQPYARHRHLRIHAEAYGYDVVRVGPPRTSIVVAPRATVLVIPPEGPRAGLVYAPPPVPITPPPLIVAVPVIGPYLDFRPAGPPPATVLDAYDHRFDYNQ